MVVGERGASEARTASGAQAAEAALRAQTALGATAAPASEPTADLQLRGFVPIRPWFAPGTDAIVAVEVEASRPLTARATIELLDLDRVVARVERELRLPRGRATRKLAVRLPATPRHGYGLRLTLQARGAEDLTALEAIEALDGWWQSPRHGVVTDFSSPAAAASAASGFLSWHVTVAQFYDWMYRHYRYAAPYSTLFEDTLGRRVAPAAVRAGVLACQRNGIAALGYGAVYGAEREYVDSHPDELVYDEAGNPLSLGEIFYINDVRPGSPWRRRLLDEYVKACRRMGFDGIHMDTYGPPHEGIVADGSRIRFEELYPGLIVEAAERLSADRDSNRVLFNCVEGYPLEAVARAPAAAIYIEVWPPDVRYRDVVRWIDRAREIGEGRMVVIAAYISALRTAMHEAPEDRPAAGERAAWEGALEAGILLSTVISAAGGYHQILADWDRLLIEGYYPDALPLGPAATRELRDAWRFGARYVHLLSDPALTREPIECLEIMDAAGTPVPVSGEPEAGRVWARATRGPGATLALSLVDLRDQSDDRWDAIRQAPSAIGGWRLRWPAAGTDLVAMSPWTRGGDAARLRPALPGSLDVELPPFRRWLLVAATGVRALSAARPIQ